MACVLLGEQNYCNQRQIGVREVMVGASPWGGWRRDFLTISSSKTPSEYIIRALPFVGSRRMRGCRTLVLFKGAGFDFSAASALFLCAILGGAFTGAETFISSPSVVIGAGREDPRVTPARGAPTVPWKRMARGTRRYNAFGHIEAHPLIIAN